MYVYIYIYVYIDVYICVYIYIHLRIMNKCEHHKFVLDCWTSWSMFVIIEITIKNNAKISAG